VRGLGGFLDSSLAAKMQAKEGVHSMDFGPKLSPPSSGKILWDTTEHRTKIIGRYLSCGARFIDFRTGVFRGKLSDWHAEIQESASSQENFSRFSKKFPKFGPCDPRISPK
jgi:hypothetical protein